MQVSSGNDLNGVLGAKPLRISEDIWGSSSACEQEPQVTRDQRRAMPGTLEEEPPPTFPFCAFAHAVFCPVCPPQLISPQLSLHGKLIHILQKPLQISLPL